MQKNLQKGVWLLGILGFIMVVLIAILVFVPGKTNAPNTITGTDGLQLPTLSANQIITSPLKITGLVNGSGWNGFEGQVGTVTLLDSNGEVVAQGILTATTEWTTLPTSFVTTLNFTTPVTTKGNLVFHNENASGLPGKNREFILPVQIGKSSDDTTKIDVYFDNNKIEQGISIVCDRVFAVERKIPKTLAVARAAVEELLKGPTVAEKVQGYVSAIPSGSKLNSISIVNGEARADFNATTESGGGSCSMGARVAQITNTLKQFPTITSVKLSIDGKTVDIFQP